MPLNEFQVEQIQKHVLTNVISSQCGWRVEFANDYSLDFLPDDALSDISLDLEALEELSDSVTVVTPYSVAEDRPGRVSTNLIGTTEGSPLMIRIFL